MTDCAGVLQGRPVSIEVTNGTGATSPFTPRTGQRFILTVDDVVHGDFTEQGFGETAVLLDCEPDPSNYSVTEVQVFDNAQHLIATLVPPTGGNPGPAFNDKPFVTKGAHLITGADYYGPHDCHAGGPTISKIIDWKWNGNAFTPTVGPSLPGPGQPCD